MQVLFLLVFNNLSCLFFELLHTLKDAGELLKLKTFQIPIEGPAVGAAAQNN